MQSDWSFYVSINVCLCCTLYNSYQDDGKAAGHLCQDHSNSDVICYLLYGSTLLQHTNGVQWRSSVIQGRVTRPYGVFNEALSLRRATMTWFCHRGRSWAHHGELEQCALEFCQRTTVKFF